MIVLSLLAVLTLVLRRPLYSAVADVKDWNDRAELYDGPFIPSRENLVFAVTRSSMMEANGFTLALFSSPTSAFFDSTPCLVSQCTLPPARIAIDAFGLIWRVPEYDFLALRALAESTRPFAYSWSIDVPYTCQAADRIILPNFDVGPDAITYISGEVSAFATGRKRLEVAVKIDDGRVFTHLPEEVDMFLRIALQRTGSETFGPRISEEGKTIVKHVMSLLR